MKKLLAILCVIASLIAPSAIADTLTYGGFLPLSEGIIIDQLKTVDTGLVTNPANIKGLWSMNSTGASTTVADWSGNSHTITLRDNTLDPVTASTCSPGFTGHLPYLSFDAVHVWDTPDHTDFSLTDGAGNDIAGTWILAGNISDFTNIALFNKVIAGNFEYEIATDASDILFVRLFNNLGSIYIGRYKNSAWTTYENTFITVIITYDGSEAATGIKIYRNATRVDDTNYNVGVYVGMTNGTASVTSYNAAVTRSIKARLSFQSFIKGEALTTPQVVAVSSLLLNGGITGLWYGSYYSIYSGI